MSLGELNKLDMQSVLHASRTASHSLILKKKRKRKKKARKLCVTQTMTANLDLELEDREVVHVLSFLVTVSRS